jgi:molybdenum cofactor cytidylyltransferase
MGTSIACGVRALGDRADAVLIALGDMPSIAAATVAQLVAAHGEQPDAAIGPRHDGKRGHPVLFPASAFGQLAALEGDRGARAVFEAHPDTATIDVSDPGTLRDIDTPDDLDAARHG